MAVFEILTNYIRPIFEFFHSFNNLCMKKTLLTTFLVCIVTYIVGDNLCPNLYKQYKELIGVCFIISLAGLLSIQIPTINSKWELYKNKKLKNKSKEAIINALNHLNQTEEEIIRSMIAQDRNNTSSFGSRYTCDLDGLYKQGILCQRDIHETSIFESEIECMDPILWEEYTPIRDYKMPHYLWVNAKNSTRFTAIAEEDLPF